MKYEDENEIDNPRGSSEQTPSNYDNLGQGGMDSNPIQSEVYART